MKFQYKNDFTNIVRLIFLVYGIILCHCQGNYYDFKGLHINLVGYEDLLVAIHPSVPEDHRIIDGIKDYIREASVVLLNSTQRFFFNTVYILPPRTWTRYESDAPLTSQRYEAADIRVDRPAASVGHIPYVKQSQGCGLQADYILLTPELLTNKTYVQENFGDPGMVLVHEWAHYRWGVFDEHPLPGEASFYHAADGTVKPVICTKNIVGEPLAPGPDGRWRSCKKDLDTALYEPSCRFVPDAQQPGTSASLMGYQFISQLTEFCHGNESETRNLHLTEAPSKQNRMCGGESAWNIIKRSTDFQIVPIPPDQRTRDNLLAGHASGDKPIFRVLRQPDQFRVIIVLDTSGSMGNDTLVSERLGRVRQALARFLLTQLPYGASVGVVNFHKTATVLANLTELRQFSDREKLVDVIPRSSGGATCITCGINEAIKVLKNVTIGSHLLVLADGAHPSHYKPSWSAVDKLVREKQVVVDSIRITDDADRRLDQLADTTGGRKFYWSGQPQASSQPLYDAFGELAAASGQSGDVLVKVADVNVDLAGYRKSKSVESQKNFSLVLDASAANETEFFFTYSAGSSNTSLIIKVISPTGEEYNSSSSSMYMFSREQLAALHIPQIAPTGTWHVYLENGVWLPQQVLVSVSGRPTTPDVRPITVSASVSAANVTFSDVVSGSRSSQVVVFASVQQGQDAVLGAEVEATIQRLDPDTGQSTNSSTQPLLDNGADPDVTSDDGLYSGYFLQFNGNGTYYVSVRVKDGPRTRVAVTLEAELASVRPGPLGEFPGLDVNFSSVALLNRATSGGYFKASDFPTEAVNLSKYYPPSQVTDLRLTRVSFKNKSVSLRFTAVGEDFDQSGPVKSYTLKICNNLTQLRSDFNSCRSFNQSDLLEGILDAPLFPGTQVDWVVRLPEDRENVTSALAITAHDQFNNSGAISNAVMAAAPQVQVGLAPSEEPPTDQPWPQEAIIGIVVGAVVISFLVVFGVMRRFAKYRARKPDLPTIPEEPEVQGTPDMIHRAHMGNFSRILFPDVFPSDNVEEDAHADEQSLASSIGSHEGRSPINTPNNEFPFTQFTSLPPISRNDFVSQREQPSYLPDEYPMFLTDSSSEGSPVTTRNEIELTGIRPEIQSSMMHSATEPTLHRDDSDPFTRRESSMNVDISTRRSDAPSIYRNESALHRENCSDSDSDRSTQYRRSESPELILSSDSSTTGSDITNGSDEFQPSGFFESDSPTSTLDRARGSSSWNMLQELIRNSRGNTRSRKPAFISSSMRGHTQRVLQWMQVPRRAAHSSATSEPEPPFIIHLPGAHRPTLSTPRRPRVLSSTFNRPRYPSGPSYPLDVSSDSRLPPQLPDTSHLPGASGQTFTNPLFDDASSQSSVFTTPV